MGIYDRIVSGVEDRVPVHFIYTALVLYADGTFTAGQILSELNSLLSTPLDADAQTDMSGMATEIDGLNAINTVAYLHRVHALSLAVEAGASISEATYRAQLGI